MIPKNNSVVNRVIPVNNQKLFYFSFNMPSVVRTMGHVFNREKTFRVY